MLITGEVYRCAMPECGCEIQVTKGAQPGGGGENAPRCCCGQPMEKISKWETNESLDQTFV